LAVDIAALHGAKDNVKYTRFDCIVRGKTAQDIVRRLMPDIEAGRTVLVGFRMGDLYVDTFRYTNGEKAGEIGVSLKARLLHIAWAKVDGKMTYRARSEDADANESTKASDARESALATARRAAGAS
jgi:hypothetical protein